MIGMNFGAFLTLLILGFISAIVVHSVIRYRMMEGFDGFMAKWVAGWLGAWLGGPVLGHWWFRIQNIYVIPALVGAFAGAFVCAFALKAHMRATLNAKGPVTATAAVPEMLRKAG
ncbi:MAG TPA: hypothetical protein VMJ93_12115 [Verrucomicrobiae bacterium]|nr:hypothetical protein [Verrucomicrobiae bacterium]